MLRKLRPRDDLGATGVALLGFGFRLRSTRRSALASGVSGVGVGVWGLGFGDWGLGFGVWGLGIEVWGLGFRV